MEAKTKAQELGFLSREYAVGKDKAKWLSLFAENAVVQDPCLLYTSDAADDP